MASNPQHTNPNVWKGSTKNRIPQDRRYPSSMSLCSSCPFPPIAIFAICLLLSQIVIFNIAVAVLYEDEPSLSRSVGPGSEKEDFLSKQRPLRDQSPESRTVRAFRAETTSGTPDGTFNGYPVYFRQKEQKYVETISHCVGENYQEKDSWQKKSCEFSHFFCFDTAIKDYVVFDRAENEKFYSNAEKRSNIDISQSFLKKSQSKPNSMSIGGINPKWSTGISRLEWFPEIRLLKAGQSLSYYELPPSVVMIPFHSLNGANPGHLVWDDFLPIFTLLSMFQLKNKSNELLLMRYELKGNNTENSRGLWASCDWNDEKRESCKKLFKKFLPLMLGQNPIHEEMVTTEQFDFVPSDDENIKSTLICAKHGVAGIGALTDHGTSKLHGWGATDYELTQNHGRGGVIYEFRNFMLRNMGIPIELNHKPPFRIIFSEKSSSRETRNFDFTKHRELLQQSFHPSYVSVEAYVLSELSLAEQLEIASQASIFITSCGGGAVSSMFMPKGSSVIMYYVEDGGVVDGKRTGTPARLDWDLFNNLGYLKVHWLPAGTMHTDYDLKALFLLIQHELETLIREKSYDHFFH